MLDNAPMNLAIDILDNIIDIAGENIYDSDDENLIAEFEADNAILREYIINNNPDV